MESTCWTETESYTETETETEFCDILRRGYLHNGEELEGIIKGLMVVEVRSMGKVIGV